MPTLIRVFELLRDEDMTGISGTGKVAEGVEFSDGTVAMRWTTGVASTAIYRHIDDVIYIHGHQGRTRVHWIAELV
jgi:hypothetical protein